MGFSISSPALKAMETHMRAAVPGKAVAFAIYDVAASGFLNDLRTAARAAGASEHMLDEICVFKQDGDIYVGVPRVSAAGRESFNLEYGTAVGAPRGWMRSTVARRQRDLNEAFGRALTNRLLGTTL